MFLLKSKSFNFSEYFFERDQLLPFYERSGKNRSVQTDKSEIIRELVQVDFIPPFLELNFNENYKNYKYKHLVGLACNLNSSTDAKDYTLQNLGKKGLKKIVSRKNKLEKCFDISYQWYYGIIAPDDCLLLMKQFKKMIEKRFSQREEVHGSLKSWKFYEETALEMIQAKKACLFVISDNNTPIAISLCYLKDSIFESSISSYDINYYKFGLGNLILFKKLEWCYQNNFNKLNMKWGDYPYKRYWSNCVFTYYSHIIYPKGAIILKLKAFAQAKQNILITYLIKNKSKFKFINKLRLRNQVVKKDTHLNFTFEGINFSIFEKLEKKIIDPQTPIIAPHIYSFIYQNNVHKNTVEVYEIDTDTFDSEYIIKSNKVLQKLIIYKN